jgi:hypothetical protein
MMAEALLYFSEYFQEKRNVFFQFGDGVGNGRMGEQRL